MSVKNFCYNFNLYYIFAVENAKAKVSPMKTIDLIDTHAKPQMPWPDVQPFPKDAPSPTNNPPTIYPIILV